MNFWCRLEFKARLFCLLLNSLASLVRATGIGGAKRWYRSYGYENCTSKEGSVPLITGISFAGTSIMKPSEILIDFVR